MARPLGMDDEIGNRFDRYKARKGQIDTLQVIRTTIDGVKGLFWRYGIIAGKRADGSDWIVTADDNDPTQNIGLEMGGTFKERCASLVIHVASFPTGGGQGMLRIKPIIWAMSGDKFELVKMLGLDAVAKTELAVTCSPGKEEVYQDLIISLAADQHRYLHKLNDAQKAKLRVSLQEATQNFTDFLNPQTRDEQYAIILGQQGAPRPQMRQGALAHHQIPAGMDPTGMGGIEMAEESGPDSAPLADTGFEMPGAGEAAPSPTTTVGPPATEAAGGAMDDPTAVLDTMMGGLGG